MAVSARVQILKETTKNFKDDWILCLQWCRYVYDDGNLEEGYRFIWRRPDKTLQAARGQARIPSLEIAKELMEQAQAEGWGNNNGEEYGNR